MKLFRLKGVVCLNEVVPLQMTWRADEGNMSLPVMIRDVYAQRTCLNEQLVDGQTYDVSIKATDIMDSYEVSCLLCCLNDK